MKRDMELVRELLLKIERAKAPPAMSDFISVKSERFKLASYNMHMLIEQVGLVTGIGMDVGDHEDWLELKLTWRGHDFLESIRDPGVWSQTKQGAKTLGGTSFDIFIELARAYVKAEAKKRLGLDLP